MGFGGSILPLPVHAPVPYLRCCCSIWRKTAGSGGFAINLGANAASLKAPAGATFAPAHHARIEAGLGGGEGLPGDERFEAYPDRSLADWHRAHGLADADTTAKEGSASG